MADEFIKWVTDEDGGFCGGIYLNEKKNIYTTILSDIQGLNFKSEEEAEAWLIAEKRGEHDRTDRN